MWRLDSTHGAFAVKELNRDWGSAEYVHWYERAFTLETAAFHAGVPMPRPIPVHETGHCLAEVPGGDGALATVRVHEWVDGEPISELAPNEEVATKVGEILARIHLLDWRSDESPEDILRVHGNAHWQSISERLAAAGSPWADDLRRCLATISRLEEVVVASRAELGPAILSHRDADQKNFLICRDGGILLVDWDAVGPVGPRHEVAKECLNWAGVHLGTPERRLARALLHGYRKGGGDFLLPRPSDFGEFVGVILEWLEFNVRRTLGERLQDPSDRLMAEREARNVVDNLPRFSQSITVWTELLA